MTASLIVTFIVFSYLLPSVIATTRKVDRDGAIILVNVVFGWTVLGWIAALIWAVVGKPPKRPIRVNSNLLRLLGKNVAPNAVLTMQSARTLLLLCLSLMPATELLAQQVPDRNLETCLSGKFPALCNYNRLTPDQLLQVRAAELRREP
jgi:Superinfection immunity protein